MIGRSRFNYLHTLYMFWLFDGKEVKDVFACPIADVSVGSASKRPLLPMALGVLQKFLI